METNKNRSFSKWVRKNRFPLQLGAMALGLLAPFGLFMALQAGQVGLAGFAFALIAAGMALTFLAG
jgi:hypothetical protein